MLQLPEFQVPVLLCIEGLLFALHKIMSSLLDGKLEVQHVSSNPSHKCTAGAKQCLYVRMLVCLQNVTSRLAT